MKTAFFAEKTRAQTTNETIVGSSALSLSRSLFHNMHSGGVVLLLLDRTGFWHFFFLCVNTRKQTHTHTHKAE